MNSPSSRSRYLSLNAELLESRHLLSSVGFVLHKVDENDVANPLSVYAADLDGDGDLDALSASFWDNKVAWYENTDGQGTFGQQHVITAAADGPVRVLAPTWTAMETPTYSMRHSGERIGDTASWGGRIGDTASWAAQHLGQQHLGQRTNTTF